MQVINKLTMLQLAVTDMPKARTFYEEKLGLEMVSNYRQDDNNWWTSFALPEGGVVITITSHHAHMQPGSQTLYFATSDIAASHAELTEKGIEVSEIGNDLHGPGSGTKWFSFKDVDGNLIHIEQV